MSPTTISKKPVASPAAATLGLASRKHHPEMPLLDIRDLTVAYGAREAVRGVSAQVYPGQITAIVGESGSGKTTTASAAIGLLAKNAAIVAGEILFEGRLVTEFSEPQWRYYRGSRIGYIPQDPHNSLNPQATIGWSIGETLRIHTNAKEADIHRHVLFLLEKVGIDNPAKRAKQYPHQLSGGMKQRVLIAAAIALQPDLIIADEPTSALDVTVQKKVLDLIDQLRRDTGVGVLLITHDLAVAGDRADKIVVMQHGQVKEQGVAASVLANPESTYTRQLIADAPSLNTLPLTANPHTNQPVSPKRAGWKAASRDDGRGTSAQPIIEVKNFTQRFGEFTAVDNLSFSVAAGTTHGLVGESGSGKTTTGRAIAALSTPTAGSLTLAGQPIVRSREIAKKIQLVYQNPLGSLDPKRTIGWSVAEPLRNLTDYRKDDISEKVKEYLQLVSLDPGLASRKPHELSGGQRQRVAIARALICEPEVVVLDEAVSALDVTVQSQILDLLKNIQEQTGVTYVFISHDLAVVRHIADTVSVLSHGKQVETGKVADVFEHPQHPYTKTLIEAIPGRAYTTGALNIGI